MRKTLLVNFLVLGVFLLLFEIVLRVYGLGYDSAAFEPDRIYHHIHKKNYHFVNDNPAEKEYTGIRVYFDKDGCVANPEINSAATPLSKRKIALMGDSFIEGLQVDFEKSITGLVESNFADTVEVKNFAVGNYSPVIYYLQIKNNPQWFSNKMIFLFLYSNDVREDSGFIAKATFNDAGNAIAVDGGEKSLWLDLARHSYLIRLARKNYIRFVYWWNHSEEKNSYATENYMEEKPLLSSLTKTYLLKIDSLAIKYNSHLILTAIPSKYKTINHIDYDGNDFAMQCKSFALQNNMEFLDLIPTFKEKGKTTPLFFQKDIHFNESGHAMVAEEIVNRVNR